MAPAEGALAMTDSHRPPPDQAAVEAFATARDAVLRSIAEACDRRDRDPAGVRLVAVSKTFDAARDRAAVAAGQTLFGENRVQERQEKAVDLDGLEARWHLVGPLQSNKARRAMELFAAIESVDSADLARRLDRIAREVRPGSPFPVLLQVNVDADPGKAGFEPEVLRRDLGELLELDALRVDGLMTIGRLVSAAEEARPTFVALRELAAELRARDDRLGADLSMGMTDDYPVAVEEGATIVRVGRALFGERPHSH